jgi:putative transposase
VVGCLLKPVQAGARKAPIEIRDAPDREHAEQAIEVSPRDYGVKWPKAVARVVDDAEGLLCLFDFPAEHWGHVKTNNPSSPPLVGPAANSGDQGTRFQGRRVADSVQAAGGCPGSLAGGQRPHLVALVRAGARFDKGVMVERPRRGPGGRRVITGPAIHNS